MSYDQELLQGFVNAIGGHGVTGVKRLAVTSCEAPGAPPHNIHAFYRLFGTDERREADGLFVITTGLGLQPLGSAVEHSLSRFELFTWVDTLELAGSDVLVGLSALGRLLHAQATPDSAPWFLGHTLSFAPGDGLGGWDSFLFARHGRSVETSVGPVDLARVMPLTPAERQRTREQETMLDGAALVVELENRDYRGTLARWHTPPAR